MMAGMLDELKADVASVQGFEQSAVTFTRGFVDLLREAFNNNDWMKARHLTDEAHSRAPELAQAMTADREPSGGGSELKPAPDAPPALGQSRMPSSEGSAASVPGAGAGDTESGITA